MDPGVRPFSRANPSRQLATLGVLVVLAALTGACGSPTTSPVGNTPTAPSAGGSPASNGYQTGSVGDAQTTPAGLTAARDVTASYRSEIGNDAGAFVAAVGQLYADLTAGNPAAARSDELAAQAAYDGFRLLESGNTVIASTLDERSTDVGPGQTLAGLHAVERDLWDAPTGSGVAEALADSSGLVAQAPVAQYLLSRNALDPEAVGTTAVDELGWVDDVAVPGDEELYSRLDAVDIAATVSAARAAFSTIQPLARMVSPALTATVAGSFATLGAQVAALGPPDRRPDATIPAATLRSLAQQVDATAALLARLSAYLAPYGTSGATS